MADDTEPLRSRTAQRQARRRLPRLLTVALLTVVLVGIGGYSLAAIQGRAEEATEEARLSQANAELIAEQVRAACDERGPVAEQLGDLCRQAEQVAEQPQEPVAIPPTDEQLRPIVRDYVDAWLTEHPPPAGEDGQDGRTPSRAEITGLIVAELERNPPPPGPQGPSGPAPTAEQLQPIVAQEVDAWLTANPPAAGPQGPPGEPGADSTVPGPPGEDGEDGEPPHSWTTTHCDFVGRCTTERCERTDPFDPSAPTYTCSTEEEP